MCVCVCVCAVYCNCYYVLLDNEAKEVQGSMYYVLGTGK